jgi:hypothetical protein
MIDQIILLLGDTTVINTPTIEAAISVASQHYLRFRPYTSENWGTVPRAYSWIMEYALATCKLLVGDYRLTLNSNDTSATELIAVGSTAITSLNQELITYP